MKRVKQTEANYGQSTNYQTSPEASCEENTQAACGSHRISLSSDLK